jgi:anti-sigma B factor antagonist
MLRPPFSHLGFETTYGTEEAIVRARGELDFSSAAPLARELATVQERRPRRIVLDFRGITFFDAAGVHLLIDARDRARQLGQELCVCCDGTPVKRVLDLCDVPTSDFRFDVRPAA